MKNLQKILLILIYLSLASCRMFAADATNAVLSRFKIKTPPGSKIFQKGYNDGCAQILYSRGNYFYRTMYKYSYDTSLNYNKEYRFGYKRGNTACLFHIIGQNAITSPDKFLFPAAPLDGGAADYNDVGLFGDRNAALADHVGGDVNGIFEMWGGGGGGGSVFTANPIWAGGSKGQIFGQ